MVNIEGVTLVSDNSWSELERDVVAAISTLREKTDWSWYRLSKESSVDKAQLSRLQSGASKRAGTKVYLRLALGSMKSTRVTLEDAAEFLEAVGLPSILPDVDLT
jgi:hypothetical protein